MKIVDEKTITHTINFVRDLENKIGFKIRTIQTDNGTDFINNQPNSNEESYFEKTLKGMGIVYRRIQPYSPWQNGKVERSHRLDNDRFYSRSLFKTEEDMHKKIKHYNTRYNNIHRRVLGFKTPNQIVEEYFNKLYS